MLALALFCIFLNSACFYYFEHSKQPELTPWDSVWLSFTTITTVGYGDYSATTVGGRIATMVLLYLVGLACFPYVITQIVDIAVEGQNNRRYGLIDCRDLVDNHIVIVNFPSELRVAAIIDQLAIRSCDRPTDRLSSWQIVLMKPLSTIQMSILSGDLRCKMNRFIEQMLRALMRR